MKWWPVLAMLVVLTACSRSKRKRGAGGEEAADAEVAAAPVIDAGRPRPRGKDIMVVIESRPPGAEVAMDGRVLGKTPLTEPTVGDGREHEFRFTLEGHDDAVVKMMLMRDGVVTGVLRPRVGELVDAGAR